MSQAPLAPLVGVSASRNVQHVHPVHRCGEKYLRAVVDPGGCAPVILPALAEPGLAEAWVERIDGLLLTGGAANVEPRRYGGPPSTEGTAHDPCRDATTLPLIRACVARGVPVLGVCLGIQEMNVAFGGTLHQDLAAMEGVFDHRMRRGEEDPARRYRPAHDIRVTPGGMLRRVLGADSVLVNSLHGQAIDRPGERVRVEATAPDGVVEAISIAGAPAFALGVQWHAEWPRPLPEHNRRIFEAFGAACRARAAARREPGALAAE